MRTNIVIDGQLMKRAMRACGAKTKRETVKRSLELMVRMAEQEETHPLGARQTALGGRPRRNAP